VLRGFPWTSNDHERFALAHQIAEMRASRASGNDIRQRFGRRDKGDGSRELVTTSSPVMHNSSRACSAAPRRVHGRARFPLR